MSYTLVVVDMQADFSAANGGRVRANCAKEIMKAIEENAPIIFLEYNYMGPTLKELTGLVRDKYGNYYISSKEEDDGSASVADLVATYKLPKHFKVCGVNTDCCVYSTVKGIDARISNAKIEVIADACDSSFEHLAGLTYCWPYAKIIYNSSIS